MAIKSIGDWLDERAGWEQILRFLRNKEVPQHKHTIWYYTGSAILVFFFIQVITGVMLLLYYKPTLNQAHQSVERIMTEIHFGWIIRSIHSWSATFMIAFVFVHLLSIWLMKAYRKPRELTWVSGVFLLVVSLAFGFTGYLLPWDELSLAATKVGTDIPRTIPTVGDWVTKFLRGGEDVTGETLTRFFGFHVSVLPLLVFIFMAFHIYLVQKHGMSVPISDELKKKKIPSLPFWPNFVFREMGFWLVLIGFLVTIAVLLPPGLRPEADLMAPTPEGIKPEWYFLFLFQTLKLFPANVLFMSGETLAVLLILLGGMLFFLLPLIDNKPETKKGKIITALAYIFVFYAVVMSIWSLL